MRQEAPGLLGGGGHAVVAEHVAQARAHGLAEARDGRVRVAPDRRGLAVDRGTVEHEVERRERRHPGAHGVDHGRHGRRRDLVGPADRLDGEVQPLGGHRVDAG